jgi:CRP-like cAMP-binding protein
MGRVDPQRVVRRFDRKRLLANVLRASPILRMLPASSHAALAGFLALEALPAHAVLVEQGRPSRGFFVVLRGECEAFHDGASERPYPAIGEGDVFGEISLLQGGAATANVRTTMPSILLVFHRDAFDEVLLSYAPVRQALYDLASARLDRTRYLVAKDLFDQRLV